MFNQSCGCHGMNPRPCGCGNTQNIGCGMNTHSCGCMNTATQGCGVNAMGGSGINGCPRPQPIVAPKKVCISNQVTPVPQPVICPIECRRVNRCMYYPVYYPQYEQTYMTVPFNQSF